MSDQKHPVSARPTVLFAALHLLCCGIPLLLLSGVPLVAFFASNWPAIGAVIAAIALIAAIWYLRRGCCNEGQCRAGASCHSEIHANTKTKDESL